tara:strand:+ start:183 stop:305 length:123 start_codon:yes stop_codon:yes gene_type:complete
MYFKKNKKMRNSTPIFNLIVYFAMIWAFFYFASKGWSSGK